MLYHEMTAEEFLLLRRRLKIHQSTLAERIGIAQNVVSYIETENQPVGKSMRKVIILTLLEMQQEIETGQPTPNLPEVTGADLNAWRTRLGLTQRKLAERSEVAQSVIWNLEHDKPVSPGVKKLVILALQEEEAAQLETEAALQETAASEE
jgi:transcriptional regulator with XRE-family HTH domain